MTDRPWLELELTMTQLKALMTVVQTGGMPSRGLADRLSITASAVTPLVDRLVDQKLVRREPDLFDRRVVRICPTAHALALRERLLATTQAVAAAVLGEVPPSKRSQVQQALALLVSAAARLRARSQETKPRT